MTQSILYSLLSNRFTLVRPDYSTEYPEVDMVQYLLTLLTVPGTEYPEVASIGTWPSYSIAIIPD